MYATLNADFSTEANFKFYTLMRRLHKPFPQEKKWQIEKNIHINASQEKSVKSSNTAALAIGCSVVYHTEVNLSKKCNWTKKKKKNTMYWTVVLKLRDDSCAEKYKPILYIHTSEK